VSDERGPADLAFVIVTFESQEFVTSCLDAISEDAVGRHETVVVDNASGDASIERARAHPSRPRIIANRVNVGFGTACNQGARASAADWLFFVNPDARLRRGATEALLRTLSGDSGLAAVGPSITDPSSGYRALSAGHEPSGRSAIGHFLLLGRVPGLARLFPPMQLPPTREPRDVEWLSGAALLVRREAFERVNGFDEGMFLYMEDVDLCRRLRKDGWRLRYAPSASVDHVMGGSQGSNAIDRWYTAFDAYLRRHHGAASAKLAHLAAFLGMGMRAVAYRVMGGRAEQVARMTRGARAAGIALAGRAK
jgi:GT2 family glycosyltransferase